MYMELVSIYCNNNNNNNNKELLDTFCDKNLSSVLLNIVVRIVTSWLQIIYSTWSTDDCVCVCVCVLSTFTGNGVYSVPVPCTSYA